MISKAAKEHGVTLMTDMSSKLGQDGKKFQVENCNATKVIIAVNC